MKASLLVFCVFSVVVVLITGYWDWVSSTILPHQTWGLYSRSFFEGILSNAHGTIIDLFVIGIVIYWFEQRRNQREEEEQDKKAKEKEKEISRLTIEDNVRRNRETIFDLRFYREPDAPYKVLGAIRRLLSLGDTCLDISEGDLSRIEIKDLELSDSNLHATIFKESRIIGCNIENCRGEAAVFVGATLKHTTIKNTFLHRAKFQNATLKGVNFTSCNITNANFDGADLSSANFSGVDCNGASFKKAVLRSANFIGATNIPVEVLDAAKAPNGPRIDIHHKP